MIQIYDNSDAQIYLPYYIAGIDFGENSKLTCKFYTVNTDNSFSISMSANPAPVYVNISGSELSNMESGVLRCLLTLSQPNSDFSDGFNDKTNVFTTEFYYKRSANLGNNYYTKSETQQIIDELEATIAVEYPDSVELETILSQNLSDYYTKTETNDLLLTKANLHGDLAEYFNAKNLFLNVWNLYTDVNDNYSLKFKHMGNNRTIILPQDKNGTIALTNDFYSNTQIDNLLTNKADKSQLANYYTKTEVDDLLEAGGSANNLVTLTQSEYDNLETVEADTYYFIVEE